MRAFFSSISKSNNDQSNDQVENEKNELSLDENKSDHSDTFKKVESDLEHKASVKFRRKSSAAVLVGFGNENNNILSSDYNSFLVPSDVQTFLKKSNINQRRSSIRTPDSNALDEVMDNLTDHIIDSIEALRNVVRQCNVTSSGESKQQQSAKKRILQTLLGSVSKFTFKNATKGWDNMKDKDNSVDDYLNITEQIIQRFPEILLKKNKNTGKCLIHLICERVHSSFGDKIISIAIKACPECFKLYDLDGSTALHILVSRKCISPQVIAGIIKISSDAVRRKDIHGNYPLNILLKQPSPSSDMIEKLLTAFPKSAQEKDSKGSLPMHAALKNSGISVNSIKSLYKAYPDGIRLLTTEGLLPIHQLASQVDPSVEVLKFLVSKYPKSLEAQSADGAQTALHIATDSDAPSIEVISFLLHSYPKAAQVPDNNGFLPLHIALDHSNPPLGLIEMLLKQYPEATKYPTKDGLLPLHLAIGLSDQPSTELIQRLVDVHPGAILQLAVEYVTGEDNVDPFSYDGHWVKRSWTPLARAVKRKQDKIVNILQLALHKHGISVDDVLEPLESSFSQEKPPAEMTRSLSRSRSVRSLRSWRSLRDIGIDDEEDKYQSQRGSDSGESMDDAPPVVRRLKSQRSLVPLPREQSPYRHPPRMSYTEIKAGVDGVVDKESKNISTSASPSTAGSPDRSPASKHTPSGSPVRYSQLHKSLSINLNDPTEEESSAPDVQLSSIRKSPLYQGVLKKSSFMESTGNSSKNLKRSPRASPRAKFPGQARGSSLRVSASDSILLNVTQRISAEASTNDPSPVKKVAVAWGADTQINEHGNSNNDSARSNVSFGVIYKENDESSLRRKSSDQHQHAREIIGFGYNDKANDTPAEELEEVSFEAMKNMPTVTIKSPRASRPSSKRITLDDGELI